MIFLVGLLCFGAAELILRLILRTEVLENPTYPRVHAILRRRLNYDKFNRIDRLAVNLGNGLIALAATACVIFVWL